MKSWGRKMKLVSMLLLLVLGAGLLGGMPASAAGGVTLYSAYTSISVPPGEALDYSVEVMNNTSDVVTVPLELNNLPKDWTAELNSGGWRVKEVSVKPGESSTVSLNVTVPLQID